jgi:hypothetical protein
MVYPKTLNRSLKRECYLSVSQKDSKVQRTFVLINVRVKELYWREERENIRGYIRRKILSALFSNNKDFTPYL